MPDPPVPPASGVEAADQVGRYSLDDSAPVTGGPLSVKLYRAVPRAVAAIQQPAPIRIERQQDPGGLAQRGAQMRHTRIHRDDEIQAITQRRRVLEIELIPKIQDLRTSQKDLTIRLTHFRLQTYVLKVAGQPGYQRAQRNAALMVVFLLRIAAPYQADTRLDSLAQALAPVGDLRGIAG